IGRTSRYVSSDFSFLIAVTRTIGIMSKRSSYFVPTTSDRARLKRRMESPVSRSDSSSEAGEGSDYDLMAPFPLSCVYAAPPLVGPASSVDEDELAVWRSIRFLLPSFSEFPPPKERASSYIPGEISVYEAFFDSGLRGTIPALIADLALIAIQNIGELEYLSLGINEVLFVYHLAPLNGGEGRFHLCPCSGLPTVEELPKNDRKGPERYAFKAFPGSSHRWNFIGRSRLILLLIGHLSDLPELIMLLRKERKLFSGRGSFLRIDVSETVLRRSSPWRDMSGGATTDPFAAYQEAAKVMSAKKRSSSRSASGDEVMITGSRLGAFSFSVGKETKSGGVTTRSAQQSADIARSAGSLATALSNLNLNVFPLDGTVLPIGDSSEVIQVLQGGLLRTVSQLHHLGGRLSDEGLLILREEVEVLKSQESREKEQCVAREFEIRDLKEKIKDLEKVAESSSADVLALEEDIEALKAAAETFKFEMVMAVNGARVVARWESYEGMVEEAECQVGLGHGVGTSQGAKVPPFPLSRMSLLFRRLLIWMWIHLSSREGPRLELVFHVFPFFE
ncbi:LOW QUALITY PROTEIN: hypothetical protein HID58_043565, partial [Brassica napus]